MTLGHDLPELVVGFGARVDVGVDGTRPIAELTSLVGAACDRVEALGASPTVVLRPGGVPAGRRSWPGDVSIHDVNRWERAVRRLLRVTAMVVVAADGTCGGPALELLLAADHRIATPRLVLVPPVNDGGFWPGMAVYWLVQHLGVAAARRIVLWGDDIPAARALELGLVDQVTGDVDAAVGSAVGLAGRVPAAELAVRRQLLVEAASATYEEALGVHLAACDRELRRLARTPAAGDEARDSWPT